jgi:hypothetical protein
MSALSVGSASSVWDIFLLFSVPIGGGMPAGVLLAKSRGMGWLAMTILYFISDVVLALWFEPLIRLIAMASKHFQFLAKMREVFKKSTDMTIARYGAKPGPIALVGIAFGVDPMTGRTAALAAGHHFILGWVFAILGDMLFFGVIAISTLCLNNILGDGTWTAIIIMALMLGIPPLIRRFRKPKDTLEARQNS